MSLLREAIENQSFARELAVNAVRSPALSPEKRFQGDKQNFLRAKQRAAFLEGESRKKAATVELDGRSRTNKQAQLGHALPWYVITERLSKLNSSLIFEASRGDSTKMGIYVSDSRVQPEGKRFICGFEKGISPEFSIAEVDASGETKAIVKGWRTVLASLIKERLINATGAFLLFGPPTRASKNWQAMGVNG